jgi:hypothetical protein
MELPLPPGYASLSPLDRTKHQTLGVDETRRGKAFAALHGIQVFVSEFTHAARHYPVVFAKDSASGKHVAIAVTGLDAGENLFIGADGRWTDFAYVPAYVRRWPFFAVPVDGQDQAAPQSLICVDESALAAGGEALFDAEGKETEACRRVQTLVSEIEAARVQTERLIETLVNHKLLQPFEAHAFPKAGKDLHLKGMYRVDEARLNALEGRVIKSLMKRGELSRIYAHMMSLDNFRYLMDRAAARPSTN